MSGDTIKTDLKPKTFLIEHIPAILLGEPSDKIYLFVHGQGGNKEEAIGFAEIAAQKGYQVLGIDLPEHGGRSDDKKLLPWDVIPELTLIGEYLKKGWGRIALRANSIGAWFSMLAFAEYGLEKCLFVSPVLDMETLITDMMIWASVTEEQLHKEGEIPTNFGQTLSWKYLIYARRNPIQMWKTPTEILYAGQDNLVQRKTVDIFVKKFNAGLTVMENGEHWFHTTEQLEIMKSWENQALDNTLSMR